ncbi:MAG: molybdenum cofactor biosynthesis protein MoaE [Phycisphaerales bacterium]|nr:MAG: molybdenum cofactor biosynthesis protein MoaE [Phycisphaerales bacterium]
MTVEIRIESGPLDAATSFACDGAGAIIAFEGIIRPDEQDRPIEAIEYEAYRPMADEKLHELAEQAMQRYGLKRIRVTHSEGRVPIDACSFRLEIASAHRAEGLEAMGWFIDTMKRDVPIWKRPRFVQQKESAP